MFRKYFLMALLSFFCNSLCAKAMIDKDVLELVRPSNKAKIYKNTKPEFLSLLVFFNNPSDKDKLIAKIREIPELTLQDLSFMPGVAIHIRNNSYLINTLANFHNVAQISSYHASAQELDISAQAIKLAPSSFYPNINNWWAHGYTGKNSVVGIIDTGIDPLHPDLYGKHIISRQEDESGYSHYINGIKEPHGTGVACIYAGTNNLYKGIAHGTPSIVSGLAGAETPEMSSIMLTLSTLDWMLNRSDLKPTLINYSMGNGPLSCPTCPNWSGLAKVIDYVVNTQKILWVKSAGNNGYIEPTSEFPFASTLTAPGDNYNALTIANMNTVVSQNGFSTKTAERVKHSIKSTSSRGPTPFGRRKPDLTAPGHDTRTCAPNPSIYPFNYSKAMQYKDGYRLMGGTSAAAPHVGAAALLMQDAGIKNPMAIRALLINSADTWTDFDTENVGHTEIEGSAWNRTYGWGYINMEKAFEQKDLIIEAKLSAEDPVWEYETTIKKGEKVTLVHERRVGYTKSGIEWKLSHLTLELVDMNTQKIIASDKSAIDSVHQVANCHRAPDKITCSEEDKTIRVLIRVRLLNKTIDGDTIEPFAIVVPNKNAN